MSRHLSFGDDPPADRLDLALGSADGFEAWLRERPELWSAERWVQRECWRAERSLVSRSAR